MRISIDQQLREVLQLGVLRLDQIAIPADRGAIDETMDRICGEVEQAHRGLTSGQVPGARAARALYRAVGIDPTKTRPSSEALLRRVLKGQPLYRIHPLVDLFNLASLASLLPVGLYDEAKIVGEQVSVQLGETDWGFEGIRKGRVNVAGRLCVADQDGPFGSPTSDSLRTSIEGEVDRALAIFFQHVEGNAMVLRGALDCAEMLAADHLDARVRHRSIID